MDHTDFFHVFSEEFTPFLPGSFVYCHPSEVETWTQSVPFGDFALPSPPETSSDCGSVDSQDMSHQTWSQASQPEGWTPTSAQEQHQSYMQPSASGWTSNGVPVTTSGIQSLDTAAWLSVSSGPVDQGLSPVLSHESQSTHTLNSFSEPECVLPPGLDLSFTAEPNWISSEPTGYYPTPAVFHPSEQEVVPSSEFGQKSSGAAEFPQGYYQAAHPQMMPAHNVPAPFAPRIAYLVPAPKRLLLPRTQGEAPALQPTHGPHRVLRPHIRDQRELYASASSVSSAAGQSSAGPQHKPASVAPPVATFVPGQTMSTVSQGEQHPPVFMQSTAGSQASAPAPYMVDPTAQDFSDFIQFDQEEYRTSPAQMSYVRGFDAPAPPASVPVDVQATVPQTQQDTSAMYQGASSVNSSLTAESDEGRHRNHPLYAAEPESDGLFHCPYKAKDASCPHLPTKLKCNYDKYIDSHLKPFRCKIETCSKQEFSSTACLLRHEREAHGMHGHGDRPHLCYYTGCERGIPGNGFPRRYNLFDHMKRVHDHKEDPRAGTRSPSVGNSHDKKAAASRKRKASDPAPLESAARRQRITPVSAQHAQGNPPAQVYTAQPQEYYQQATYAVSAARRTQAHSRVYHHWANQRDLIERQMGSVQSPDDEAGLQRLTQNVEEFRRLSEVVRRG